MARIEYGRDYNCKQLKSEDKFKWAAQKEHTAGLEGDGLEIEEIEVVNWESQRVGI